MVASRDQEKVGQGAWRVSIPFIAGQWSLPRQEATVRERAQVSIPFIAGQWSLHALLLDFLMHGRIVSIPFIAGQWSLLLFVLDLLIRGAGVSIPFIAGQWSLPDASVKAWGVYLLFQSPSLRGSGRFGRFLGGRRKNSSRFNPLHCGAVVASNSFSLNSLSGSGCFNPLHCGAVVASQSSPAADPHGLQVSIPFIAGQWSLLVLLITGVVFVFKFQSPSLRGSGRFGSSSWCTYRSGSAVSIPFIAGQWSLRVLPPILGSIAFRFNPLHCGAVVASKGD